MSRLNLPSGGHEQQSPEQIWFDRLLIAVANWSRLYKMDYVEKSGNSLRFRDKDSNQITIKITAK